MSKGLSKQQKQILHLVDYKYDFCVDFPTFDDIMLYIYPKEEYPYSPSHKTAIYRSIRLLNKRGYGIVHKIRILFNSNFECSKIYHTSSNAWLWTELKHKEISIFHKLEREEYMKYKCSQNPSSSYIINDSTLSSTPAPATPLPLWEFLE